MWLALGGWLLCLTLLFLAACAKKKAGAQAWASQKSTITKIRIPEASKRQRSAKATAAAAATAGESSVSKGKASEITRTLRTARMGAIGAGDEDQLSDYERRTQPAQNTAPPEIPENSGCLPLPPADASPSPSRPPLTFASRGRVKIVPKDQKESWNTDKSRLVQNPERRLHPLRTLQERGGWLIDRSAFTGKKDPITGEHIPVYVWIPATTAALARVTSADGKTKPLVRVSSADAKTKGLTRVTSADAKTKDLTRVTSADAKTKDLTRVTSVDAKTKTLARVTSADAKTLARIPSADTKSGQKTNSTKDSGATGGDSGES